MGMAFFQQFQGLSIIQIHFAVVVKKHVDQITVQSHRDTLVALLMAVAVGVLSSRGAATGAAASDSVWTPAFFVGQGFDRTWLLAYVTLMVAACGFLVALGVFGLR